MLRAVLIIVILMRGLVVAGQSVPLLKEIADKHFDAAQYTEAIEFYKKIVRLDKQNLHSKYRLALSYYRTLQYDEARKYFSRLIQVEGHEFRHLSLYYFGTIQKLESNFSGADSTFAYLLTQPNVDDELLESGRKQKEGCQLAINQKKENRGFVIEEMEGLNSRFHDFGAIVNQTENTLVFVTTRNLQSKQFEGLQYDGLLPDLVQFTRRNDNWRRVSSRKRFNNLNTEWSEGSGSFTDDGQTFYFTSCQSNDGSDCKIMVSKIIDDRWSEPYPLNEYINPAGFESKHPFITGAGDTLFFVSNREGGYGGSDIWMSLKGIEEDFWTPAINLGDAVNTASNEITPYYSSAFNCLVFSSDGHVGYGGFDIFAAKGESFFEPEIYNLGDPFNSPLDDTYFNISDSVGFISSNRQDKRHLNLHSFDVSDERLYLSLLISGESLIDSRIVSRYREIRSLDLATFRVEDYQGFELFDPVKRQKPRPAILDESPADGSGASSALIAANTTSQDEKRKYFEDYLKKSTETVDNSPERQISAPDIVSDAFLASLAKSEFEKIYFRFGSATLTNEARLSLNSLAGQLLSSAADIQYVQIVANTDDVGSDQYNFELSTQRGIAIRDYLVSRGLPPGKILIAAKGEAELITRGTSWYERLFNRRAEVNLYGSAQIQLEKSRKLVVREEMDMDFAAELLNVPLDQLKSWNSFGGNRLSKGQIIRVNQPYISSDIRYFLDETDIRYNFFPYVVKEGENIGSIVKKFGTPEELIVEINRLEGEVNPGDELFIYKLNF